MISARVRRLWFVLANPLMWLNGRRYRLFGRPPEDPRVHLGCGRNNYIRGWINVDANILTAKVDLWINLLHRLPFPDNTVSLFYSNHVLEHFSLERVPRVLKELYRSLRNGGWIRLGVPHAGNAARRYVEGDAGWFSNFPRRYRSIGGRMANLLLCAGEHLSLFDESFLSELLEDAGFKDICVCQPGRSDIVGEEVLCLEKEPTPDYPHTLYIEATKAVLNGSRTFCVP